MTEPDGATPADFKATPSSRRRKAASQRILAARRRALLMRELERHPSVSMPELAAKFKTSESTVGRDKKAVDGYYKARATDSREAWLGHMLMHYESIYTQADEAWEASCKDKKVHVVQSGGFTQSRKESQSGDAAMLNVKTGALAAMTKLLGLDAPTKASLTVTNTETTAMLQGIAQICVRAMMELGATGEELGRFTANVTAFLDGPERAAKAQGLSLEAPEDDDEIEVGAEAEGE